MATRDLSRLTDLEVRLYRMTTRSHLRVGAGEGSADVAVENPIIRALVMDEKGGDRRVPYVPGSSLHGVVRAWVEKALRSGQQPLTGSDLKARVEQMQDTSFRSKLVADAQKEIEEFRQRALDSEDELYGEWRVYVDPHVCNPLSDVDKCERIPRQEGEARAWKATWWQTLGIAPPCAVCRIFGYMGQRGRVKISHAWPTTEKLPLDIITRVAINRLTGAADEGKLFDLEAIPPGVTFHFFVVMENMEEDKHNFDTGIRALNMQLAGIGAHSTVGFGMVDIEQQFQATISPNLFERDVENEFINVAPEGQALRDLTDVDVEKIPRFFRALVAAHARQQDFGDLITFEPPAESE